MNHRYILTGPPGSGKSTILKQLANLNYAVVEEPVRSILSEQRAIEGVGVYDKNIFLFKELILSRMMGDYLRHSKEMTFFDRGIPDVVAYSECLGLELGAEIEACHRYQYNLVVFYAPPWKEIFVNDNERRLSFAESVQFGESLKAIYKKLGYQLIELPFLPSDDRANLILDTINM